MEAGAGTANQRRLAWPNGLWGMALFLGAEVTIFGTLLSTYFYLEFEARRWPPPGIALPELTWPLVATGWLVASTGPMFLASRAARRRERGLTAWMIALALIMQCAYVAAQVLLFQHDLDQFSPQATAYGSIYFTILAVHHAHVVLGLLLDLGILWQVATRGLTDYWLVGVRCLALYWYVVAGLAVLVVLTQVSPAL